MKFPSFVSLFLKKKTVSKQSARRVTAADSYRGVKVSSYYTATQRTGSIDVSRRGGVKLSARSRLVKLAVTFVQASGLYALLGVICLVALVYSLFLGNSAIVTQNSLHQEVTATSEESYFKSVDYQKAVNSRLANSVFNKTKLTLRSDDLKVFMKNQYPEIAEIRVQVDVLGAKPRVWIKTYEPIAQVQNGQDNFIVLENGVVVKSTPHQRPLLRIIDSSGVAILQGSRYLRQDDSEFLRYVAREITKQKQWGIEYIKITSRPREILVKAQSQPYEVKMYLDDDPVQQVGSWLAAIKRLGEGGELPTEYIDVRIGEKVFWK